MMSQVTALSPAEFESQIRHLCDSAYDRAVPEGSTLERIFRGELPRADVREWFMGRWNLVLILNQYILPNLMRRCPDLSARAALWPAIAVEFGGGDQEKAHPTLYRRFVCALGATEEQFPERLSLASGLEEQVARVESMTWLQLLGQFLGRETVGPKVFDGLARALKDHYGLSERDVEWFVVHGVQDVEDSDVVFNLARQYGESAAAQAEIRAALAAWFDGSPYCYGFCRAGHRFARSPSP
jgi:pyrroloquinoline quinone (PQQ) biosynthesis protein C